MDNMNTMSMRHWLAMQLAVGFLTKHLDKATDTTEVYGDLMSGCYSIADRICEQVGLEILKESPAIPDALKEKAL
ncbi:MAG: hypothetical protein Pg6A_19630 [Termitinemataceae bacterium]|nr:MAG: hypothetical protein Pg6A_19630 [Termitinemataceae bacterium]